MKKLFFIFSVMFALCASNHLMAQNAEELTARANTVEISVGYCYVTTSYNNSCYMSCEVKPHGYNIYLYNGGMTVPGGLCMEDRFSTMQLEVGKKYDVIVGRTLGAYHLSRTFTFTIKPTDKFISVNLYDNSIAPEAEMFGY